MTEQDLYGTKSYDDALDYILDEVDKLGKKILSEDASCPEQVLTRAMIGSKCTKAMVKTAAFLYGKGEEEVRSDLERRQRERKSSK